MTDNSNEQFTVGDMLRDLATRIGSAYIRVFGDPQILYLARTYTPAEWNSMSLSERDAAVRERDETLSRESRQREEERDLEERARRVGMGREPKPEYETVWEALARRSERIAREEAEERQREEEASRNARSSEGSDDPAKEWP